MVAQFRLVSPHWPGIEFVLCRGLTPATPVCRGLTPATPADPCHSFELGHIFLRHDKRDFYDAEVAREYGEDMPESAKPPWEQEADAFAAELLIPMEQLKKYQAELKNPETVAGIFQVSRPAMAIAIANLFGSARSFK